MEHSHSTPMLELTIMKTTMLLLKLKTTEFPDKEEMTLMSVLELLLGLPLVLMVTNILTSRDITRLFSMLDSLGFIVI